jgi:hypothetical protein
LPGLRRHLAFSFLRTHFLEFVIERIWLPMRGRDTMNCD